MIAIFSCVFAGHRWESLTLHLKWERCARCGRNRRS